MIQEGKDYCVKISKKERREKIIKKNMKIKKREKKKVLNKDNKERFEVPRKENEKCLL